MSEPTDLETLQRGTELVKRGFAKMQKGGVIMDVVNREQARIAEDVGAVAVMNLEAVPADIRKRGGVARMSAGTASRFITATAPTSSAIRACSRFTTSMMTPPFCIFAKPRLTSSVPRRSSSRSVSSVMSHA